MPLLEMKDRQAPEASSGQQDIAKQRILSEKWLHVPHPFLGNSCIQQHTDEPRASTHCSSILHDRSWCKQDFCQGDGTSVFAEYTQGFNENDITYFHTLYERTMLALGFFPTHLIGDGAFTVLLSVPSCGAMPLQ